MTGYEGPHTYGQRVQPGQYTHSNVVDPGDSQERARQFAADQDRQRMMRWEEERRMQESMARSQQQMQDAITRHQPAPWTQVQPQQQVLQGGGYAQPSQPLITPGAVRRGLDAFHTAIYGPIMLRIYQNWKARTADTGRAVARSMTVVYLWKVWVFTLFIWLVQFMAGGYMVQSSRGEHSGNGTLYSAHDLRILSIYQMLVWAVLIPAIGCTYVRLVDMSLFKHRFLWRVLRPVERVVRWVPFPILITAVLAPIIFDVYANATWS